MTKQTIVILEGADMVGKTHIAAELSKQLNIPVVKVKRVERWFDPFIDLVYGGETMVQMVEQTGYNFIFDRGYPSEYAYSRTYERPTSHDKILSMDARFAKMGALIVVCYKHPSAYQPDDQALIDVSKYDTILKWFREFKKFSKCKVLMLDTTDENLESQLTKINAALNGAAELE